MKNIVVGATCGWWVFGWACLAGLSPQGIDSGKSQSLKQTVSVMAEKKHPPALEYARMAEETISFGSQPDAVTQLNSSGMETGDPQKPWRDMVGDALAGVDVGEKQDPRAADWKSLREQLQKLQPPAPNQKQKSPKKSKEQKKDSKKDKNSGEEKKDPQSGKGDQEQKGGKKGEGEGGNDSQSPPSQGKGGKGEAGASENSEEVSRAKQIFETAGAEDITT
ncbi:hypothetical protein EBX31_03730, partial [bacterium]|nr:hypothetical protein [bacterium]